MALIRKEHGSDFGVEFPDFPGCVTAGRTLDEAIRLAPEALAFHIRGMREDGEEVPEPSPLDHVLRDPNAPGGVPTLVKLPAQSGRAVRINITLEDSLLSRIDAFATAHNETRSALLARAAEKLIGQRSRR